MTAGCDNCYALTLAKRLKGMGSAKYQIDGDPRTAWRVGGAHPEGQAITIVPDPVPTVDAVRLLQPPSASEGRAVQSVRITVGHGAPVDVVLGPESLAGSGQLVPIPSQPADSVTVEITGVVGGTPDDHRARVGPAHPAQAVSGSAGRAPSTSSRSWKLGCKVVGTLPRASSTTIGAGWPCR